MNLSKYRKGIVFILDLIIIIMVSAVLFHILPEYRESVSHQLLILMPHLLLLLVCVGISQYLFKIYDSIWRYAESKEYLIMAFAGLIGYICYFAIDYIILKSEISMLFTLAVYSISLLGMLMMRLCYRQYRKIHLNIRNTVEKNNSTIIPLAIIGAGEAGVKLHEEITSNPNSRYKTICFIDDSDQKIGKKIHNIPVLGPIINLQKLLLNTPVKEIIIAIPSISQQKQKTILEICSVMKYRVQILPNTLELLQNQEEEALWKSVRDIKIEGLLGREPIILDNKDVEKFLSNKVILVTGGGGSIGSELCRQIAKINPKRLIILDIYENNAYDIQQELIQIYGDQLDLKVEIASVSNKDLIFQLFERYRPNIVFHAAAHKHVPLMENCPEEAILNNIFGTYHVVQASKEYEVEKFVLISTDKAVNPTSIMGASKRFCEMILQSMNGISKTEYVAVRFGNVLGSNGSVIPLFQKQIAGGGPVTITDKRIVRFFMTISEAVQLVLQAGSMANSTEIYVLDMGQPVRIIDLAENLIRLSGHVPYTEIPIIETGLRPGEKLYEELLMNSEELIATANQKIFIEIQQNISQKEIKKMLKIITRSIESKSMSKMKRSLKKVVPTYRDAKEVNAEKHGHMKLYQLLKKGTGE